MKQSKKNNIRRMAVYAMLIALAMIFSYVESQVPPFFAVPGMKLGLTNIVVVTALYKLGNAVRRCHVHALQSGRRNAVHCSDDSAEKDG